MSGQDYHFLLPDDQDELLRAVSDRILTRLNVAYPAIVTEDTDGNTLKTKIAVKGRKMNHDTGEASDYDIATMETVPLHFAGGGGKDEDSTILTHPVKVVKDKEGKIDEKESDHGIVVMSSRAIGNWWSKGGSQPATDLRLNALTPMFIPGIRPKPRAYKWHDNKNTQLRSIDKKHVINHDPHAGSTIKSVEEVQKAEGKEENDPYEKAKKYYSQNWFAKAGIIAKATEDEGEKQKTKNHTTALTHSGHVIAIGRPGKDNVHTHTSTDKGIVTSVESGKHIINVHHQDGIKTSSSKTFDIDAPTHIVNAVTNIKKETTIDKLLTVKDDITSNKNIIAQLIVSGLGGQFGSLTGVGGGGSMSIGSAGGLTSILGGLTTGAFSVDEDAGGGAIKMDMLGNYANDGAAAAGGVAINQLYRNGSVLMIRVS